MKYKPAWIGWLINLLLGLIVVIPYDRYLNVSSLWPLVIQSCVSVVSLASLGAGWPKVLFFKVDELWNCGPSNGTLSGDQVS